MSAPCILLQPDLLTIVPGSINIENFIPGRVYKQTITIYNTCNIPIIINLRSSDKSKLIIDKTLLRIEVNDSQKVDLVIQDKINYAKNKLPTKPKKLFVIIKGELIEEKFEVNLMYFCNKNTNQNLIQENYKAKTIQMGPGNSMFKEIPSNYLTQCQNKLYSNNMNYYEINTRSNNFNKSKLKISKCTNFFIRKSESSKIIKLKNLVNNLMQQLAKYKGNNINFDYDKLNNNYTDIKNNNFNNLNRSRHSFCYLGNKILNENEDKFKIDCEIEKNAAVAQNKILKVENATLTNRIKLMEEKLAIYENNNDKNFNMRDFEDKNNNYNDEYGMNNIADYDYMANNNNNFINQGDEEGLDYGGVNDI